MKECKVYMCSVLDQQRYITPDHLQLLAHVSYLLWRRGIQCILKKRINNGYVNNHPSDLTCLVLEWNFQKLCYQHGLWQFIMAERNTMYTKENDSNGYVNNHPLELTCLILE